MLAECYNDLEHFLPKSMVNFNSYNNINSNIDNNIYLFKLKHPGIFVNPILESSISYFYLKKLVIIYLFFGNILIQNLVLTIVYYWINLH